MVAKKEQIMAENINSETDEFFKIVRSLFPQNTQTAFGEYIGVNQGTVSKWFRGVLPVPYYAKVIMAYAMERSEGGFDPFLDVDSYFKDQS